VYRWIKRGWIKAVILPNGQIRIPKKELEKVLTALPIAS